jgi:hypothetical protein
MKRLRTGATYDPVRDWLALITLAAILLIGIIIWNVWTFETVANGGSLAGAPQAGTPTLFDRSSLDSIHKVFEKRASEAAKYETGVYRYTDPSQ